ncbi:uncharacterized protein K452DRAFT_325994 [Aplosporella prunicola CBS 121167]|uniref:Sin3-associated polypeptide Sap18 n=1 Tax=Aplosporella prunicola CBS 121167 TaxID=1176127 RepID=A0A6A6BH58_9PEZI|nr:uncharacterized protein K452DRAFT_325994 [Aplosporella prunicola CBS 121167]KAF2143479.1 hypothetical protein K452DRAFT_325994 [Aplosporella prunicola CBS 121167]
MSSSGPSSGSKYDRQTTTPFLLKLFYRTNSFHRLEEFSPYASSPPPHLQIYTWPTCTLRELTHLLVSALPSVVPSPAIGTRLAFKLIFPDARDAASGRDNGPARYVSKDLGSVVIGAGGPGVDDEANGRSELDRLEGDADKTLHAARFIIGDYVSCAIFPPLSDGSVAPPPPRERYSRAGEFGMSRGGGGPPRENGYGGGYGRRGGGRYDGPGRLGSGGVPSGEWRRGEVPSGGPGGYGRGRGRGRPY